MRLTLAPIPWFWPRQRVFEFYAEAAGWPLDVVYLGETVCSKRRELKPRDWLALAAELRAAGREVVLSTQALIEAESELATLRRLVDEAPCLVEANDMAAVQLLRERGLPFVAGPSLNVYNAGTVRLLQADGMRRLVLGVEHGQATLAELRGVTAAPPELELQVWGQLPLAHSARCFTARAHDLIKDDCAFRCLDHPEGLPLATREGQPFLTLNGVQVMSAALHDLGPELHALCVAGVDLLRIQPQAEGTEAVVRRFRAALDSGIAPPRLGAANGYWYGTRGSARVEPT